MSIFVDIMIDVLIRIVVNLKQFRAIYFDLFSISTVKGENYFECNEIYYYYTFEHVKRIKAFQNIFESECDTTVNCK